MDNDKWLKQSENLKDHIITYLKTTGLKSHDCFNVLSLATVLTLTEGSKDTAHFKRLMDRFKGFLDEATKVALKESNRYYDT